MRPARTTPSPVACSWSPTRSPFWSKTAVPPVIAAALAFWRPKVPPPKFAYACVEFATSARFWEACRESVRRRRRQMRVFDVP